MQSEPQEDAVPRQDLLNVFMENKVEALRIKLSPANLQRVRDEQKDVKQHIADTIAEMRSAVDRLLRDLGPGPVLEASDAGPARHTRPPETVLSHCVPEPGLRC